MVVQPAVGAQHLAAGDRRPQGGVRCEPLGVRHRHRPLGRAQPFRRLPQPAAVTPPGRWRRRPAASGCPGSRAPVRRTPAALGRSAGPMSSASACRPAAIAAMSQRATSIAASAARMPAPARHQQLRRRVLQQHLADRQEAPTRPCRRCAGTRRPARRPSTAMIAMSRWPGSVARLAHDQEQVGLAGQRHPRLAAADAPALAVRAATVVIAVASDPACGSVSEKPPSASPVGQPLAPRRDQLRRAGAVRGPPPRRCASTARTRTPRRRGRAARTPRMPSGYDEAQRRRPAPARTARSARRPPPARAGSARCAPSRGASGRTWSSTRARARSTLVSAAVIRGS